MGLTVDRGNPCLQVVKDNGQQACYLILSDEERSKGFVRPVRRSYIHLKCGTVTTMAQPIAETYARDPKWYGATFCSCCRGHFPVGENGEFVWHRDEPVFKTPTEYEIWLTSGEKVGS